jgi:AcrR family transcriptional regulator
MSKENARTYRSPSRAKQASETQTRILDAAMGLFQKKGFDGTTIDAIAAEAGVAAPTVYAAFKSKRGIFMALLDSARFGQRYQTWYPKPRRRPTRARGCACPRKFRGKFMSQRQQRWICCLERPRCLRNWRNWSESVKSGDGDRSSRSLRNYMVSVP